MRSSHKPVPYQTSGNLHFEAVRSVQEVFFSCLVETEYDQAQKPCDDKQEYGQCTAHTVVLAEQMLVQVHDQCHGGTHRITGFVCQNLWYVKHLHAADQGCDHNVDQDRAKKRESDPSKDQGGCRTVHFCSFIE